MVRAAAILGAVLVLGLFGAAAAPAGGLEANQDGSLLTASVTAASDALLVDTHAPQGPPVDAQRDDRFWDDRPWGGWWIIMPIMMVIFWGAVLGVAVWGIRQFTRDRQARSPLDIAKERLARGEISKEEFDGIRDDLV